MKCLSCVCAVLYRQDHCALEVRNSGHCVTGTTSTLSFGSRKFVTCILHLRPRYYIIIYWKFSNPPPIIMVIILQTSFYQNRIFTIFTIVMSLSSLILEQNNLFGCFHIVQIVRWPQGYDQQRWKKMAAAASPRVLICHSCAIFSSRVLLMVFCAILDISANFAQFLGIFCTYFVC